MSRNKNRIREGSTAVTVTLYAIATLIGLICVYPMYYVLILSVSDPIAAMSMAVYTVPKGFTLSAYETLVKDAQMWLSYRNTFMYVIPITLGMLTTSMLAGYALSIKGLRFRRELNIFLLIPMYFGGGLIPTFLVMTKLNLYDNPLALIVPAVYSMGNIILVKAYLSSIPESLREAAKIDGASVYQTLFHVYLPMSMPILAVLAVYTIVDVWNSWFNAAVYLPHTDWQPLQLYLRRVLIETSRDLSEFSAEEAQKAYERQLSNAQIKYAIIVFCTLPIILTYPYFQKYFIKGVMLGSLKE